MSCQIFSLNIIAGFPSIATVPASIFGLVYMFGRQKFFTGYAESAEKRFGFEN